MQEPGTFPKNPRSFLGLLFSRQTTATAILAEVGLSGTKSVTRAMSRVLL
jgi:hypothetical protein